MRTVNRQPWYPCEGLVETHSNRLTTQSLITIKLQRKIYSTILKCHHRIKSKTKTKIATPLETHNTNKNQMRNHKSKFEYKCFDGIKQRCCPPMLPKLNSNMEKRNLDFLFENVGHQR